MDQSQQQTQTVQISVQSAGDLELEQSIFRDVSSVGRQLSTLLDVVEELLNVAPPNSQTESAALQRFRQLRVQIATERARVAEKRLALLGQPDELVTALDALLQTDPQRFEAYRARLADWSRLAVAPGALNR